jgi:hypothetical protein
METWSIFKNRKFLEWDSLIIMIYVSSFPLFTLKTIRCRTRLQQNSWFCPNIVVRRTALSRLENSIILGTMRCGVLTELTTNFSSFWNVTPCSLVEANTLYSCLASSSTTKTSEMSAIFYQIVRCHFPEDNSLHYNSSSLLCDYLNYQLWLKLINSTLSNKRNSYIAVHKKLI